MNYFLANGGLGKTGRSLYRQQAERLQTAQFKPGIQAVLRIVKKQTAEAVDFDSSRSTDLEVVFPFDPILEYEIEFCHGQHRDLPYITDYKIAYWNNGRPARLSLVSIRQLTRLITISAKASVCSIVSCRE